MHLHLNLQRINPRLVGQRHQGQNQLAVNSRWPHYERSVCSLSQKRYRHGKVHGNRLQKQSHPINVHEQRVIKVPLHLYHPNLVKRVWHKRRPEIQSRKIKFSRLGRIWTTKQDQPQRRRHQVSRQDQLVIERIRKRDISIGRRQKVAHSISRFKTDPNLERLVGRQHQDCHDRHHIACRLQLRINSQHIEVLQQGQIHPEQTHYQRRSQRCSFEEVWRRDQEVKNDSGRQTAIREGKWDNLHQ